MISVKVKANSGDLELSVKGHAEFAPHGQDIVCAAVSNTVLQCVHWLKALSESYPDYVKFEEG